MTADYRPARKLAIEMALELIGKPRDTCAHCGAPLGAKSYAKPVHTARSAAALVGINHQAVSRALRLRKK